MTLMACKSKHLNSAKDSDDRVSAGRGKVRSARMEPSGVDRLVVLVTVGRVLVHAFLCAKVPDADRAIVAR